MRGKRSAVACAVATMVGCGGPLNYRDVGPIAAYTGWYGNYAKAAAILRSNLEELEAEGGYPYDTAWNLIHLSYMCWATGEVDEALDLAERAVREAEGLPRRRNSILASALIALGYAYRANREYDRARDSCERARSVDDSIRILLSPSGSAELCIGDAALASGDLSSARSNISSAYEIRSLIYGPYSFWTAHALVSMAVLRQYTGQPDQAERDFTEASSNIEFAMREPSPFEALALERYAVFLEGTGRRADAQDSRDRAAAIRSQLGSCKR